MNKISKKTYKIRNFATGKQKQPKIIEQIETDNRD